MSENVDLSVVVPARNEEMNLPVLLTELTSCLGAAGVSFELIVVDDGSEDGTAEWIRRTVQSGQPVKGVMLSRNFGHQAAVSTGLRYATGRAIGVMDADLQDRPSDLLALQQALLEQNADVVYAVRRTRREGVLKQFAYKSFYRLLSRMSHVKLPLDSGDFCVMRRSFVEWLNALPERERYVRGLRAWLGGKQVAFPVDRDARRGGKSQYTLSKLMRLAMDGIISFSYVPLRLSSWAGVLAALAAFAGFAIVLAWKAMGLLPNGAGVATVALSVLFLGGVQLVTIGILGEYLGRVFDEVKSRPVSVVAQVLEKPPRG